MACVCTSLRSRQATDPRQAALAAMFGGDFIHKPRLGTSPSCLSNDAKARVFVSVIWTATFLDVS